MDRESKPDPASQKVVKRFDISRQATKFYDRIITDIDTHEIAYSVERQSELLSYKNYFRIGGQKGVLIATCDRNNFRSGATIKFLDESQLVMEPKKLFGFSRSVFFNYGEQRYRWKGTKTFRLRNRDGEVVAKFERQVMALGRDGMLEVYELGKDIVHIIVMTLVMVLYRVHTEEWGY